MSGAKSSSFSGTAKRYEVQFQKDSQQHSDTNDLERATLYARSLANWNLAAQVYDRATQKIIFRARAYAEKRRDGSMGESERRIVVHHKGENMKGTAIVNDTSVNLKAFRRGKSLELSKWYMGCLTTNLAESNDTNGAFFLVEATMAPGNEPPPHVHSREDELFYVLEGEFDVYAGQEAFKVRTGECVFLPRFVPHAFVVRSPRLQLLTLFTPGGLEGAFRGEGVPAGNLDLPSEAITYSMVELEQTARRFSTYGARFLTPDEIAEQLPLYPKPLPPIPKTKGF